MSNLICAGASETESRFSQMREKIKERDHALGCPELARTRGRHWGLPRGYSEQRRLSEGGFL